MSPNNIENPEKFWKAVLGEVELLVSPMIFRTVLSRTKVEKIHSGQIDVACDDDFTKKTIETKFKSIVENSIEKIAGKSLKLQIQSKKDSSQKAINESDKDLGPLFGKTENPQDVLREKQKKSNLSPNFLFENYIMGKNNNLAFAIATAVAEKPGELYNPVFIYSGVGLGKTHLLQAIGNRILQTKPGMKVVYTTGEAFTNELIEAIQSGRGKGGYTTNEFRNKFRKADVFLIDDIQFVIGRATTQEEFFHTFNELYLAQKQIVITSDRPPKDFNNLEDRITSRFSSGIIADIQNPDMEVRAAILRTKRDENKDPITNDVIDAIAEKMETNIRELMGAYIQVVTYAKATGIEVNLDNLSEALGQSVREREKKVVNVNDILKAVCNYYTVRIPDIKGERRTKELVIPRQVAMYLMKEITGMPLMTIGEFLGGRDHTTIMHGVEKIETEIKAQGKLKQDVSKVKQMLFED